MKFLILCMLMSAVTTCKAAAGYEPIPQKAAPGKVRIAAQIIQGPEKHPFQLATKQTRRGRMFMCVVTDPHLGRFPDDFAETLIEQTPETVCKESFRGIVDGTVVKHLPTELLAEGITSPRIIALLSLSKAGTNVCCLPTQVGSSPAFLKLDSSALITLKGGYPDSDVATTITPFCQQKHISILEQRGEDSIVKKLAKEHLATCGEFDIAILFNQNALSSRFKMLPHVMLVHDEESKPAPEPKPDEEPACTAQLLRFLSPR